MQHDDYYMLDSVKSNKCELYLRLVSRAVLNLFACKVSCEAVYESRERGSRRATAVIGNASDSETS